MKVTLITRISHINNTKQCYTVMPSINMSWLRSLYKSKQYSQQDYIYKFSIIRLFPQFECHMTKQTTYLNSVWNLTSDGINFCLLTSKAVVDLFWKYIAVVKIINQWVNESKKSLFSGMIENESQVNLRTCKMVYLLHYKLLLTCY
jgi:hypothetical protein